MFQLNRAIGATKKGRVVFIVVCGIVWLAAFLAAVSAIDSYLIHHELEQERARHQAGFGDGR